MLRQTLKLALLAASLSTIHGQSCTPCEGGVVDASLSFDGVSCTDWLSVAGNSPADSPQCAFDRMVGVWFCGCPVPTGVTETCNLCGDDGTASYNAAKAFPDSNVTCSQISSIPAIDGNATCRELRAMGDYCECPFNGERCNMCPGGGDPVYPNRTFLTSGETCQYILDILYASPGSNCGQYVPDMMIDFVSFCGCPGAEAPKTCSLCPAGMTLAHPDREVMLAPGSTCSDFVTYTEHITGDQLCDFMHEVIAYECCEGTPIQQPSGNCTFCDDGSYIAYPERGIVGLNYTCGDLAARPDTPGCVATFDTELDLLIDTNIYCGCPNATASTGVCSFCPPGEQLLYPDRMITHGVPLNHATCDEYAAMAASTSDTTFCSAIQSVGDLNGCCGIPGENTTTVVEPPPEGSCNLCDDGGHVQYGERLFLGTNINCRTYKEEMQTVPQGPICDAIFQDFNSTFDPQIYCGCNGAVSTGTCSLCPAGLEIVDPSIFISQILTTCGQMSDIAAATSNQEFCASIEDVGEYYCCASPGTTIPPLPTVPPQAGGGGGRHLRSSVTVPGAEGEEEEKPEEHVSGVPGGKRPHHFAAIKAVNKVEKAINHLVENGVVFKKNKMSTQGDKDGSK